MDVLSRLIEKKSQDRLFGTYKVNGANSITHLMYADDVLLFSKANPKTLRSIKGISDQFSVFTGLDINSKKLHCFLKYMPR